MKGCVGLEVILLDSWGQLPKLTHILGSHVNQKAIGAYLMGKREKKREVLWGSHCKASYSSSYSVSAEALHFL